MQQIAEKSISAYFSLLCVLVGYAYVPSYMNNLVVTCNDEVKQFTTQKAWFDTYNETYNFMDKSYYLG